MDTKRIKATWIALILGMGIAGAQAADTRPPTNPVAPKVTDKLQTVTLNKTELSGEIGRRIDDLIYKNYMVIDIEKDFVVPFQQRRKAERRYIGLGKLIAAGSRFAAYTGDAEVRRRTTQIISELMKTRDLDGYLGHMPVEPDGGQNYRNFLLHEQEYLILGLVESYRYGGDAKSLQYARELADYVITTFPKAPRQLAEKISTAGLPEALLALYGCTGEARYLEFAASTPHGNSFNEMEFASLRDWNKSTLEERKTGHVYCNLARCYAQTMLYRFEPQGKLLAPSRFILKEFTHGDSPLFVTGSASEDEHFACTHDGRHRTCESCVTAYLIRLLNSFLLMEGDLRYGDIIERSIYNALFAAQDPDGRQIRYYTPFEGQRSYYFRDTYCCPGNYRRIVAELPEMVYYRTVDGGVAVNLFTSSKKTIALDSGRSVTIQQETDYPSSGLVKIAVTPSTPMKFPLRLRIPRWCSKAALTINGQPREVTSGQPYCEILRTWKPGDVVELNFPMEWRWVKGIRDQEGRAALMRGPVVYCAGTNANNDFLKTTQKECPVRDETLLDKTHPLKSLKQNPIELVIDPTTLGEPVPDTSVRPHGLKVTAKAWAPGTAGQGPATLDIVLTEFVDPSGIATYFRVPDQTKVFEDELATDAKTREKTVYPARWAAVKKGLDANAMAQVPDTGLSQALLIKPMRGSYAAETAQGELSGRPAWMSCSLAKTGKRNMEFRVYDPRFENGACSNVTITVLYLDKGDCKVSLIYDSGDEVVRVKGRAPGAFKPGGEFQIGNTGSIKRFDFKLPDARFGKNLLLEGTDFRLMADKEVDFVILGAFLRPATK
jgi:DUF1680 family protein